MGYPAQSSPSGGDLPRPARSADAVRTLPTRGPERRPRRALDRRGQDDAVTEIVGTLLLLAVAVGLAGAFVLFLFTTPPPTPESHIDVSTFILPAAPTTVVLEHRGGETLALQDLQVTLTLGGTSTSYDVGERLAAGDPDWSVVDADGTAKTSTQRFQPGDQIRYTDATVQGAAIQVFIADSSQRSEVLAALAVQSSDTAAPVFVSAVTTSTTTVEVTFSEPLLDVAASDFTVTVPARTISSARLIANGSIVEFTVTSAWTSDATPHVNVVASPAGTHDLANNLITGGLSVTSTDGTAPSITSVSSGSPTSSAATVTWTTDETANTTVYFGVGPNLGRVATGTSGTAHSASLSQLTELTLYYFTVASTDAAGNTATSVGTPFTTADDGSGGGGGGTGMPYLALTTAATTAGSSTSGFSVVYHDDTGAVATPASAVTVYLSTNSSAGEFRDASDLKVQSVTISGSSSASFKYYDERAGIPTIIVGAEGVIGDLESVVVSPASLAAWRVQTVGRQTAGTEFSIVIEAVDTYGNLVRSYTTSTSFKFAGASPINANVPKAGVLTADTNFGTTTGAFTFTAGRTTGKMLLYANETADVVVHDTTNGFTNARSPFRVPVNSAAYSELVLGEHRPIAFRQYWSGPFTVAAQDAYGNNVTQLATLAVTLSGTDATFSLTPGGTSTTTLNILAGKSAARFYVLYAFQGAKTITMSTASPVVSDNGAIYVDEAAQQLDLTVASVTAGTRTAGFSVTLRDLNGNAINAPAGGLVVQLSTNSSGGNFRNSALSAAINTITISGGSSSASFGYYDERSGYPVITATATGAVPAAKQVAVDDAGHSGFKVQLRTQGTKTAGTSFTVDIYAVDDYGNVDTSVTGSHVLTWEGASPTGGNTLSGIPKHGPGASGNPTNDFGRDATYTFTAGVAPGRLRLVANETADMIVTERSGPYTNSKYPFTVRVNSDVIKSLQFYPYHPLVAVQSEWAGPFYVIIEDLAGNNITNFGTDVTITLSGTSVTFATTPGGSSTSTVIVPKGYDRTQFYVRYTASSNVNVALTASTNDCPVGTGTPPCTGSGTLYVSAAGGGGAGSGPNYLEFSAVPASVVSGVITTSDITVTLKDSDGATVSSTATVPLSSDSDRGVFYNAAGSTVITSVTLSGGVATFEYRDYRTDGGTSTIRGSLVETIAATGAIAITATGGSGTDGAYLEISGEDATLASGVVSTTDITVTLKDWNGVTLSRSTVVTFETNSTDGVFWNSDGTSRITTLTLSGGVGTFEYQDFRTDGGTSVIRVYAVNAIPHAAGIEILGRGHTAEAGDSPASVMVRTMYTSIQDDDQATVIGVSIINPTPTAKTVLSVTITANPVLATEFFSASASMNAGSDDAWETGGTACALTATPTNAMTCTPGGGAGIAVAAHSIAQFVITFTDATTNTDDRTILTTTATIDASPDVIVTAHPIHVTHNGGGTGASGGFHVEFTPLSGNAGNPIAGYGTAASQTATGGTAEDFYVRWNWKNEPTAADAIETTIRIPPGWSDVSLPDSANQVLFADTTNDAVVGIRQPTKTEWGFVKIRQETQAAGAAAEQIFFRATPPDLPGGAGDNTAVYILGFEQENRSVAAATSGTTTEDTYFEIPVLVTS